MIETPQYPTDITRWRKLAAWLVHLYTISGGIIAFFGLLQGARGHMREAFALIIISRLIDGTDGLLARAVRVWEVLPHFSGELVDHLIDIFSFMWLPLFLMWSQNLLPHDGWYIPPIVGSLYVYGLSTKSDDYFFRGFPILWGVVLIYLYYLQPVGWLSVLIVTTFSILCFVPIKFLYPSHNPFLSVPTWILSMLWVIIWFYILAQPNPDITWVYISLFFPIYYFLASFYATYATRTLATGRPHDAD